MCGCASSSASTCARALRAVCAGVRAPLRLIACFRGLGRSGRSACARRGAPPQPVPCTACSGRQRGRRAGRRRAAGARARRGAGWHTVRSRPQSFVPCRRPGGPGACHAMDGVAQVEALQLGARQEVPQAQRAVQRRGPHLQRGARLHRAAGDRGWACGRRARRASQARPRQSRCCLQRRTVAAACSEGSAERT